MVFIGVELHFLGCKAPCSLIQSWKSGSWDSSKTRSRASVQSVPSIVELGMVQHQAN